MNKLQEMIDNAVNAGACEEEINLIKQCKSVEEACKHKNAPYWCYWYAYMVVKGRWEEGEEIILTSPEYAFCYAYYVLKRRWEIAEPIIFSDNYYKQEYCKLLL